MHDRITPEATRLSAQPLEHHGLRGEVSRLGSDEAYILDGAAWLRGTVQGDGGRLGCGRRDRRREANALGSGATASENEDDKRKEPHANLLEANAGTLSNDRHQPRRFAASVACRCWAADHWRSPVHDWRLHAGAAELQGSKA